MSDSHMTTLKENEMSKKCVMPHTTTSEEVTLQDPTRREFARKSLSLLGGAALMAMVPPGVRSGAWAAGSDAPEKTEVKIGFIPLTDCASVVIASVMGFDKKYGIKIIPSKEASWAACATSW